MAAPALRYVLDPLHSAVRVLESAPPTSQGSSCSHCRSSVQAAHHPDQRLTSICCRSVPELSGAAHGSTCSEICPRAPQLCCEGAGVCVLRRARPSRAHSKPALHLSGTMAGFEHGRSACQRCPISCLHGRIPSCIFFRRSRSGMKVGTRPCSV